MRRSLSSLLRLVAYIRIVECLSWDGPRSTPVNEAYLAWTPRPTEEPCHEMARRQASMSTSMGSSMSMSMMTRMFNLCGYVSGNQNSSVTCGASSTCMYHVGNGGAGMAGCCTASDYINCGWNNACVDMAGYMGGDCNANCSSDAYTAKCTNAASPYCMTYTYSSPDVLQYICGSDSRSKVMHVQTTYSGEGSSAVASDYQIALGPATVSLPPTIMETGIGMSMPTTPGPSSSMSMIPTVVATTITTSAAPSAIGRSSSTPVGAIIGGVIGGIAVVGGIIALIIFLFLRRRSNPPLQYASYYGPAPMEQPLYYNPQSPSPQQPFSVIVGGQGYPSSMIPNPECPSPQPTSPPGGVSEPPSGSLRYMSRSFPGGNHHSDICEVPDSNPVQPKSYK